MQEFQKQFLSLAIEIGAISFGDFTLKSGRKSPYFFNIGKFNSGEVLARLGESYAACIRQANLKPDVLFGPAYKGIPLVCTTAIGLANQFKQSVAYCFNRKEVKDHGEGGQLVGAPLSGNVVIVDDVITAGTAIREAMQIIAANQASIAGIVLALDRQERGQNQQSAVNEVASTYHIPVISIINLDTIMEFVSKEIRNEQLLKRIEAYRQEYGVKN